MTFWPQGATSVLPRLDPCFKNQLHKSGVEDQTAEYPCAAVTCAWLYLDIQAGELRCPPLVKVTKHGRHRGV